MEKREAQIHSAGRQHWLDFARSIAIISVVCNHAMSRSFHISNSTHNEFLQMGLFLSFVKAFLYVFSRLGVPLFLMITGALLLDRKYEEKNQLRRFITHNWMPLLRTTMIWLAIMFVFLQFSNGSVLKKEGFIRAVKVFVQTVLFINVKSMASMWYMYMILCVYLMIPVFSVAVKRLGGKYIGFMLWIVFMSSMFFPNLNTFLVSLGSTRKYVLAYSTADLFSIYFLYIFSGYWVHKGKLDSVSHLNLILMTIASVLLTVFFQLWIYISENSNYHVRYADVGILVSSLLLFECLKRFCPKDRCFRPVAYLSKASFGIYFIHICVMTAMKQVLDDYTSLKTGFLRFTVLFSAALLISLMIIHITGKSRICRKYLYNIKD